MNTPWQIVKDMLIANGSMTTDGITRTVRARVCADCGAPVLAGFDADIRARPCTVDPTPLSQLGEVLALLAGRYTVELSHSSGRHLLDSRHQWRIAGQPAGTGRADVLASHVCGAAPLPGAPTVLTPRPRLVATERPPF